MGSLYLIRHGQASFGRANYDQLSDIGHEHSAVLGEHLKQTGLTPHRTISGSMQRHQETMTACVEALGHHDKHIEDAGFDEYDHQEVLARYHADFADPSKLAETLSGEKDPRAAFQRMFSEAVRRWVAGGHDDEYTESWQAFKARCVAAAERAADAGGSGHNTLIFTSGGAISVIVQHALGLSDEAAFGLNWIIANTSVTRLIYGKGQLTLSYFNNYRHVEGDTRLLTYR